MKRNNRQVYLARRPEGPVCEGDFALRSNPVGDPADGEVLLENRFLSIDPAIRQWLAGRARYIQPIAPGGVVRSVVLGKVAASRLAGFGEGDWVRALGGWETYSVGARDFPSRIPKDLGVPLSYHLGAVGNTGLAALFGLREIGKPQPGETVLVSAAAGAVGSVAGQLARLTGCRAVGTTGADEKCAWLRETCGFDGAINYTTADLRKALKEHCPHGIDVYFDNVGGILLEAALGRLRRGGRVVLCGATSHYNTANPPQGPANYLALLECGGRMEGFLASHFMDRFDAGMRELAELVREKRLHVEEQRWHGLESAPEALCALFDGKTRGKVVVVLGEE